MLKQLLQEPILTSPAFTAESSDRPFINFLYYHLEDNASLQLEAFTGDAWRKIWARERRQGSQWSAAMVRLPTRAEMLRFIGPTAGASSVALDAIGVGVPTVEFLQLSCGFESDMCLWFNAGDVAWLRGAGNASEGGWWIEAGNGSVGGEFIMQSAHFSLASDRFLKFSYQLAGSTDAFLEVQHQTTPGEWTSLFLERGDKGTAWHSTTVTILGSSTALRFVAGAAGRGNVKVDALTAYFVSDITDVSCSFEADFCGWFITKDWEWERQSGRPLWASTDGAVGPETAFRGNGFAVARLLLPTKVFENYLTCPAFPPTSGVFYMEFAYYIVAVVSGSLELQYLRNGSWLKRWAYTGSTLDWQQAKVSLPSGTEQLRFLAAGSAADPHVDAVVVWQPQAVTPKTMSFCSGAYHNCALHSASGRIKCWGDGAYGKLGSGSSEVIGDQPGEMGTALVEVDLRGARATQVACGRDTTCAVLEGGALACWGVDWGVGANLPLINLGAGAVVVQIECHKAFVGDCGCALLDSGAIRCFVFSRSGYFNPEADVDSAIPLENLGVDFAAVQLAAGRYHTCALSSRGALLSCARTVMLLMILMLLPARPPAGCELDSFRLYIIRNVCACRLRKHTARF